MKNEIPQPVSFDYEHELGIDEYPHWIVKLAWSIFIVIVVVLCLP